MNSRFAALAAVLCLAACAQPKLLYTWGGYPEHLLKYQQKSSTLAEYARNLRQDISLAEAGGKVPPGLYAEYGYALLESGNAQEAVTYFAKESEAWPESAAFMHKMIEQAQASAAQTGAARGPTS